MTVATLRAWMFTLACALFVVAAPRPVGAHSPHDTIDTIAVSPDYVSDRTVFLGVTRHLARSRDGGETWENLVNGLDNVYHYSSLALSPHFSRDATLMVATNGDGVYRSSDGGTSWQAANDGLASLRIIGLNSAFDEALGVRYFALSEQGVAHHSIDGGSGWKKIEGPEPVVGIASDASHVLAAGRSGALYRLQPERGQWEAAGAQLPSTRVSALHWVAGELFIGTGEGQLLRWKPGGESAVDALIGFDDPITSIASLRSETGELALYVTTWQQALYVSRDGGSSWEQVAQGLSTDEQANDPLYYSAQFREVVVAGRNEDQGSLFLAGFDGLFKRQHRSTEWRELETRPVANIKGLAVGEAPGGQTVLVVSTYGGGIYISEDGGDTWANGNYGVQTTRFADVVVSPNYRQDRTMFSGVSGHLTRSRDGGIHWETINYKESQRFRTFVKRGVRKGLSILGFDEAAGSVFAPHELSAPYPHSLALAPDYPRNNTLFIGTRWHGLLRSQDEGKTSDVVLPVDAAANTVTNIRLSPDFSRDGAAYASVRNVGLYTSRDGGAEWALLDTADHLTRDWEPGNGHADSIARDVHVDLSRRYSTDKTILAGTRNGLYRSVDEGRTWTALDVDRSVRREIVLMVRSAPDNRWLISLKGHGLYASSDSGNSFSPVFPGLIADNQEVEYIEFSPFFQDDDRLYLASDTTLFDGRMDGTWREVSRRVRYEDERAQPLRFSGTWTPREGDPYSGWSERVSANAGDSVELSFTGTGVSLHGTHHPDGGELEVFIDGESRMRASQLSAERTPGAQTFSVDGLAPGRHTVKIVVLGGKRSGSSEIAVDYFDILTNDRGVASR